MRIGLMGFEFESSNKGCEALSYSFVPMLVELAGNRNLEIVNLSIHDTLGRFPEMYPEVKFTLVHLKLKRLSCWKDLLRHIRLCDCVFDITHGDSFSDIYGLKWFFRTTLIKQLVLFSRVPLILLPQTYGPFSRAFAKDWAAQVIKASSRVYCRDKLSANYLLSVLPGIPDGKIKVFTDVAFALDYRKPLAERRDRPVVGINVSGLLWDDSVCGSRLGLTVDYPKYLRRLIRQLTNEGYAIHLVPHVLCNDREGYEYFENDCRAIDLLAAEFPACHVAGPYATPVEAKSYISGLDALVAARMHASIGAFSSGVATIPFSYSRKFKGLYDDLGYEYIVDGCALTTEGAVDRTMAYIAEAPVLQAEAARGMDTVNQKIEAFKAELKRVMNAETEGRRHEK